MDNPTEATLALVDRLARTKYQQEREGYISMILGQVFEGRLPDEALLRIIEDLECRDVIGLI